MNTIEKTQVNSPDRTKDEFISFRVSKHMYKLLMLKAKEDRRFNKSPNLAARYLIEQALTSTDTKSIKTMLIANNEVLHKLVNRSTIIQVTLENMILYDLAHHPETPEEYADEVMEMADFKFNKMMGYILKDVAEKKGCIVERMIMDNITDTDSTEKNPPPSTPPSTPPQKTAQKTVQKTVQKPNQNNNSGQPKT